MDFHYLDIETTGLDPMRDEILSIQTHRIVDGKPVGEMSVHRAWDSDEDTIVRQFFEETQFFADPWKFIPIGFNLGYELKWLFAKGKKAGVIRSFTRFETLDKPRIDLKDLAVLMNGGRFKGAKLENFSAKMGSGDIVIKAIRERDFATIEHYIQQETQAFLELYEELYTAMPAFWKSIAPKLGVDASNPAPYRVKAFQ